MQSSNQHNEGVCRAIGLFACEMASFSSQLCQIKIQTNSQRSKKKIIMLVFRMLCVVCPTVVFNKHSFFYIFFFFVKSN